MILKISKTLKKDMKKIKVLFLSVLSFLKINNLEKNFYFYSENFFYKNYYYNFFKEILKEHKQTYILTSDIKEYENIIQETKNIFYIGDGFIKVLILNLINARYFFTTMPGIGSNIKRSKFCDFYVYFFHALASSHIIYKNGSFDKFDIILTNGKYQNKELEINFKNKNIINTTVHDVGYFFLDYLLKKKINSHNNQILFAPSWNYDEDNLFNNFGKKIANTLINNDYKLIFRPHPEIIKRSKNLYNIFVKNFKDHKNFYLDLDPSNFKSMEKSKILITDNSSIAMEFGLVFQKPTIYIDYKQKIHNIDYKSIKLDSLEELYKNKFGFILNNNEIDNLPEVCQNLKLLEKKEVYNFIDENLSNVGCSVSIAKEYIFKHQKNNYL